MALVISELLEGRDRPLAVRPGECLVGAIEQMLRYDYTQLPVTTEDGEVLGIVSSDSILSALEAFGLPLAKMSVANAMRKPRRFDPDADAGDLLNALRDDYAVLVVDSQGHLQGIITAFDASEYFRRRSEDMMLVEDIESSLKEHVLAAFQDAAGRTDDGKLAAAIASVADPNKSIRKLVTAGVHHYLSKSTGSAGVDAGILDEVLKETGQAKTPEFEELTLKAYIDLVLHDSVWSAYSDVFGLEKAALRHLLEHARDTRNKLAHFRLDISATERERLRFCAEWLERHRPRTNTGQISVAPLVSEHRVQPPDIVPIDEEVEPGEGRYAKLAVWLQRALPTQESLVLSFNQIEEILGGELPESARGHRSWWANDSVSHPQSKRWLEVGWRISNLNLADEVATFSRIEEREKAYIRFFSRMLVELKPIRLFPLNSASPSGISWHTFARLPGVGLRLGDLVCSFARGERVRVEFYLDCGDKDLNKAAFARLQIDRSEIDQNFGEPLSWEPLENRRACRIAVYRGGAITGQPAELNALATWSADALVRLHKALAVPVSRAVPPDRGGVVSIS